MAIGRSSKAPSSNSRFTFVSWTFLVLTTIIALFPMYWLFTNALTPISSNPPLKPILVPAFQLDNIVRLLGGTTFYLTWMRNSLLVTFCVTLWHVFFDTMAGYAFAKKQFPLRNVFFWLIVSTLMIPPQVTLIPLYVITLRLGLHDNLLAVILPGTALTFGIFLMRQFIQTLPSELEDAARVDGASVFTIYWRIILPLAGPVLTTLAILTFVSMWNSYFFPLVMLNKPELQVLTVGLTLLQGQYGAGALGPVAAALAMAIVPVLVIFLLLQKYIIQSIVSTGIKG